MTSIDYAEHRTIIKFCVNLWKTPIQTWEKLEAAKVMPPVYRTLIFKWQNFFSDGRESIEDEKGRGRKATLTMTSIRAVKDDIERDPRYVFRDMCNITGISGTVYRILTDNLNMNNLSSRCVPRRLIQNIRKKRVPASRKFLAQYRSPPPKEAQQAKSIGKQMYIFFMGRAGIVLQHAFPLHNTVNAHYSWKQLQRDLVRTVRRKPSSLQQDRVLLHQYNATSHSVASTKLEISLPDLQVIEHAHYSSDMSPMDFNVSFRLSKMH